MSSKYIENINRLEEKEIERKITGEGRTKTLSVGIKGCPTDLFLTESAKRILMSQGDWYKVNREKTCNPKFESNVEIQERNNTTKESRTDSLLELATNQNGNRSVQGSDGQYGDYLDCDLEPKKEKQNGVRRWLRRFWDAIRTPSSCFLCRKKTNKVGVDFHDIYMNHH